MNDENSNSETSGKPIVVYAGPPSIEEILKYFDQAPDEETERFVSAIYADRRESAAIPRSE